MSPYLILFIVEFLFYKSFHFFKIITGGFMDQIDIQQLLVSTREDLLDLTNMSDIHFNRLIMHLAVFATLCAIYFFTSIPYMSYVCLVYLLPIATNFLAFGFIRYAMNVKNKNYKALLKMYTENEHKDLL
jgi:hypothetical protein